MPLEQLASLLVTPDAHLVTLRDEFVGYVLPSKVWGCVASGRPVLYVGSTASDVLRICSETPGAGPYLRVAVGDARGIQRALDELASPSFE